MGFVIWNGQSSPCASSIGTMARQVRLVSARLVWLGPSSLGVDCSGWARQARQNWLRLVLSMWDGHGMAGSAGSG
jgi:hypothetical protein